MIGGFRMNNGTDAWNRFAKSGKISDYLIYRGYNKNSSHTEAVENEDEHRRHCAEGDGHGRK